MALPIEPDELRAAHARLAPYARRSLEAALDLALRMHSEELVVEHVFSAILADEQSAAAEAVLHAFADPETLSTELAAMCPGIAVVGADRCVPFSVRAVAALLAARRSGATVEPRQLYAAAVRELDEDAARALALGGTRDVPLDVPATPPDEGPIFQTFSRSAKRAASEAGHEALRLGRTAVSPAHLVLGCLGVDEALREATGLTAGRARARLSGADDDPTPPAPRAIPASPALTDFLAGAPPGADTLDLLALLLRGGAPELIQLFVRQKVGPDVVARARGSLRDPD